jgi:hypothetical protein
MRFLTVKTDETVDRSYEYIKIRNKTIVGKFTLTKFYNDKNKVLISDISIKNIDDIFIIIDEIVGYVFDNYYYTYCIFVPYINDNGVVLLDLFKNDIDTQLNIDEHLTKIAISRLCKWYSANRIEYPELELEENNNVYLVFKLL